MDKAQHLRPPLVSENEETDIKLTPLGPDLEINAAGVPMDGGRDAWLAVVGCWVLIFNSWFAQDPASGCCQVANDLFRGLSNAFGVFETYYLTVIIPHSSSNSITWIGSIQSFLTGLTGVFGGWLIDSGRYRLILVVGTFLEVFGMLG